MTHHRILRFSVSLLALSAFAVQALAHGQDLPRFDLDVGGGPAHAAQRLVQQKARVG